MTLGGFGKNLVGARGMKGRNLRSGECDPTEVPSQDVTEGWAMHYGPPGLRLTSMTLRLISSSGTRLIVCSLSRYTEGQVVRADTGGCPPVLNRFLRGVASGVWRPHHEPLLAILVSDAGRFEQ